jgi:hypothetical protein
MAEVLNGKIDEVRDQEVLIERPDGSRVVVVVNIRPLKDSDGELTGAINCFYDIRDRKLTEAALIKSEKLLNAMEAVDAGGTIDIRARKASQLHNPGIHGVRVTISDNGVGISATNMRRIFEPFFYHQGREWNWARSLGGEWDCRPFWWLDSDTKQRASWQARNLLFDFSARQGLNGT